MLCRRLRGERISDALWRDFLQASRSDRPADPAAEADQLVAALSQGELPADSRFDLGGSVKQFAFAAAVRGGVRPPTLDPASLGGAPMSFLDDAIDARAIDPGSLASLTTQPRRYAQARMDPMAPKEADLEALGFHDERARRAYERGDRATLQELPQSPVTRRLLALDALREGDAGSARQVIGDFGGEHREILGSLLGCLETGSLEDADPRLLEDGTAWPVLAKLLPQDLSALADLASSQPSICSCGMADAFRDHRPAVRLGLGGRG